MTEVCVVGAEFYHVDGQSDVTNLITSFRNFESVPKMLIFKNVTNENIKATILKTHTHTHTHRPIRCSVQCDRR